MLIAAWGIFVASPVSAATLIEVGTRIQGGIRAEDLDPMFILTRDYVIDDTVAPFKISAIARSQALGGTLDGIVITGIALQRADGLGGFITLGEALPSGELVPNFFGDVSLRRYQAEVVVSAYAFTDFRLVVSGSDNSFAFGNGGTLGLDLLVERDPVGEVPLPAAAWLLLGGLGMLGAAARRRRDSTI